MTKLQTEQAAVAGEGIVCTCFWGMSPVRVLKPKPFLGNASASQSSVSLNCVKTMHLDVGSSSFTRSSAAQRASSFVVIATGTPFRLLRDDDDDDADDDDDDDPDDDDDDEDNPDTHSACATMSPLLHA